MLITHFGKFEMGEIQLSLTCILFICYFQKTLSFYYPILDPSFDMLDIRLEIMTLFHPDPIKINFKEDN